MAKGYPSKHRAQGAFWRGVRTANTGRGFNPYRNDVLKRLFERGRLHPNAVPPPQFAPKVKPHRPTRPGERGARASGGDRRVPGGGNVGGGGGPVAGRSHRLGDLPRTPPPPRRRPRPDGW